MDPCGRRQLAVGQLLGMHSLFPMFDSITGLDHRSRMRSEIFASVYEY